ncbi:MAG: GH116 family glycosyl-hydrolase [Anaerolineae bacterium]
MATNHQRYSPDELRRPGLPPAYEGTRLDQVAFPLGGIGTGCVSLNGRGGLVDWEIFNRPNKGSVLPYSFFTIWARAEGGSPVTRVLQSPPSPPFTGQGRNGYAGLGFGVGREDGAGLPHLRSATFKGEFPLAEIEFADAALPLQVRMEAYSPFIPMNADDSGLPIAVLRYQLTNTGSVPVDASIAGSMFNAVGYQGSGPFIGPHLGQNSNTVIDESALRGLHLTSAKYAAGDPRFGSLALTTTWPNTFCQEASLRAGWFDAMHDFWDHFSATGTLPQRSYSPSEDGSSDVGTLGLRARLQPGETVTLPFFVTWHFPNFVKYWGVHRMSQDCCCGEEARPVWRNYYASQWQDALDVARYYAANEERLYRETKLFHDTLFASRLPPYVLDAVSSQASILHSPTVLRLTDGTLYGFEGCHSDAGCCEGSCTHVWNYAQTAAFLFPALERSLRDADYKYNMRADGHMGFRLQLPLGSTVWQFTHAAADGQLGGIMKVYRDWRLCGDDDWLRSLWPKVKLALEYAWQQWDPDRDGVIEGIQHNTYDIEFSGPNTMMGSFYLGALRAAEEMARHLGEDDAAGTYHRIYESGRGRMERELFNGEWYMQKPDWERTPKYQYGEGCLSDQMIGQWFARIVGLGDLFDPEHVRTTMAAIFRHNWRSDFWEHGNPQRIYALNDEAGLLLCTWPRGGRPDLPFVYSDEVWCGIEYQVASHLIYEGLVDEGLAIVKGVRDRHDGQRRNPWNEFECGSHYARSLASWAVLTALSGFSFDMPIKAIGFDPRLAAGDWRAFWSVDGAWGLFEQQVRDGAATATLSVAYGALPLERLVLAGIPATAAVHATIAGNRVAAKAETVGGRLAIVLPAGTRLSAGESLELSTGGWQADAGRAGLVH